MFLYRDDYYNEGTKENHNLAECIIAKNRHGETKTVELQWLPEYTTLSSTTGGIRSIATLGTASQLPGFAALTCGEHASSRGRICASYRAALDRCACSTCLGRQGRRWLLPLAAHL